MFCVIGNMITNGQTELQLLWRIAVLAFCAELPLICLFISWPGAILLQEYSKQALKKDRDPLDKNIFSLNLLGASKGSLTEGTSGPRDPRIPSKECFTQ